MVTVFVDNFPFDSDDVAIETAKSCFSSVSDLDIVRPHIRFLDDSFPAEHLRNHWLVNFDIQEEGVLASTATIKICIDASSGEVSQLDWDFSKRRIGIVRKR